MRFIERLDWQFSLQCCSRMPMLLILLMPISQQFKGWTCIFLSSSFLFRICPLHRDDIYNMYLSQLFFDPIVTCVINRHWQLSHIENQVSDTYNLTSRCSKVLIIHNLHKQQYWYNPSPVSLSPARLVFIGKAEYMSGTAQTPHTEHEEYEDGIADYNLYHTEHVQCLLTPEKQHVNM